MSPELTWFVMSYSYEVAVLTESRANLCFVSRTADKYHASFWVIEIILQHIS